MARKLIDVSRMPVMPERCKTCPFNEDGCQEVRATVEARLLSGINQTCHSTGVVHGKPDTHLCRGARDFMLRYFHCLGLLSAPTDEAWRAKREELNL